MTADDTYAGGASRDRGGVAAGVGPDHRGPGRAAPGRRAGRGTGAGRPGRRVGAVACRRHPGQSRRLAHADRPAPGHRPDPPERTAGRQAEPARPRAGNRAARRPRRVRRRPGRGQDRRRPAAADVHLLPSGAVHRGEDRADPAPARRPDHRGDRPRVPGGGADDRQADRAGQADAGQQAGPVRGSVGGRTAWAARLGARGALPGVQRGILGDGRGRLDAPFAVRRSAAPRPRAGRADAGRTRGARPGRADGDPGVAAGGPARSRTGCRCRCPSRTAAAGTSC